MQLAPTRGENLLGVMLPLLADNPASLDIAGNPTVGMWGYSKRKLGIAEGGIPSCPYQNHFPLLARTGRSVMIPASEMCSVMDTIRRIGDIELLEDGTTQMTHRVTPSQGAPYVEKTIWEKQVRK